MLIGDFSSRVKGVLNICGQELITEFHTLGNRQRDFK